MRGELISKSQKRFIKKRVDTVNAEREPNLLPLPLEDAVLTGTPLGALFGIQMH